MDKKTYDFKALEQKYAEFMAPSFEIKIGRYVIDSSQIPVSSLSVEMNCKNSAGGCSFVIESQYDYETSSFAGTLRDIVKIGEVLSIKAGYVAKKEIFFGCIDSVTVNYSTGSAPTIEVSGIDAKAYLMSRGEIEYFSAKPPAEAVRAMLAQCVSAGYAKSVTVGSIKPFQTELIRSETDTCAFLTTLASLYGMNFFIIDGEIIFDDVYTYTSPIMTLTWGENLMEFSKSCSLEHQVASVTVHSNDPKSGEEICGTADRVTAGGEGSTAVVTASRFSDTEEDIIDQFAATEEECRRIAQIQLNRSAMEYVSGEGKCIGIPELIPGRYVRVRGLDPSTDGLYFINKVKHKYGSESGYHVSFSIQGAKSR